MIPIKSIYFFKTIDKSPFLIVHDSDVFNTFDAGNAKDMTLTEIDINTNKVWHYFSSDTGELSACDKISYSVDIIPDSEYNLPYILSYLSGDLFNNYKNMFTYSINILFNNTVDSYSHTKYKQIMRAVGNDKFQCAFTDYENNNFICYAEFSCEVLYENNYVWTLNFTAEKVKDILYKVTTLTVS